MIHDVVDGSLSVKRGSVVEPDVIAHGEFPRVGFGPSPSGRQPGNDGETSVLPGERVVHRDEEPELSRVDRSRVERRHPSELGDTKRPRRWRRDVGFVWLFSVLLVRLLGVVLRLVRCGLLLGFDDDLGGLGFIIRC